VLEVGDRFSSKESKHWIWEGKDLRAEGKKRGRVVRKRKEEVERVELK